MKIKRNGGDMAGSGELLPGDPVRLGAYWLAGRLGSGGQGVVYEAYDDDGLRVAVKVLYGDPGLNHGIAREVTAAERVASFCIARVLGHDLAAPKPYIVSEYIEGPSLRGFLRERGRLGGADLHRLAVAVATALTSIHEAGVIHRDLKPDNVLLGPDGPRVIDFGIARTVEMSLTSTGLVAGTPTYMAPEVLTGQRAGMPADVFAWGAIILFAATGRDPFRADSLGAVMYRVLSLDPDLGDLDDPLRALVASALDKDPASRPTARELLMGLLGGGIDPLKAGARAASGIRTPSGDPSLGARAEEVFARLTPESRGLVAEAFLRMVGVDADSEDTVRRVERAELPAGADEVLAAFAAAGLVTSGGDEVTISRTALLRAWPRLREWVEAERPGLVVHRELATAARRWRDGHGDPPQGRTLESALWWAATGRRHLTLNALERSFLDAGTDLTRRRGRVRRLVTAGLALLLAIALSAVAVAVRQGVTLAANLDQATARSVSARAEALRSTDPRAAMLLSAAAWRISPVDEARTALYGSLAQSRLDVFSSEYSWLAGDGRTLYAADEDGVRVWDVATHERIRAFSDSASGDSDTASVSRDGLTLLLAGDDTVRLVDARSGKPLGERYENLMHAEFGDGTRVFWARTDRERTQLWRVGDGKPLLDRGSFDSVAVSPGDRYAALFHQEGAAEIWDLSSARRLPVPTLPKGVAIHAIKFSPDGRTLAIARHHDVLLWDVASGKPADEPLEAPGALWRNAFGDDLLAYTPDGRHLAVVDPGHITLWRVADRARIAEYPLDSGAAALVRFDADGGTLRYSTFEPPFSIVSLDVSAYLRPPTLGVSQRADATLSPDGRVLALAGRPATTVELWDVARGRLLGELKAAEEPAGYAHVIFSPDSRTLAVSPRPGPARTTLWDVATLSRLPDLDDPGKVAQLARAFSPDGRTLVVSSVSEDGIEVSRSWDLRTRKTAGGLRLPHGGALALLPYGRVLSTDGKMTDQPSGEPSPWESPGTISFSAAAVSPDGRFVAVGVEEGRVAVSDARTGKRLSLVQHGKNAINAVAFSSDGTLLASGTPGEIRLWDPVTSRPIGPPLAGPTDLLASLAFDADGTLRAAGWHRDLISYPTAPERAVAAVCVRAGRALTEAEWREHIPDLPYRKVCH
ncbi:protein kinase [Streptosporangium sp. NPDC001681]|uniref:serine/threonine-protein kinase n=1 Tax=Streptosporangium sp. NPDC001681 TaxID=3154395 RepID=UPI003320AFF2